MKEDQIKNVIAILKCFKAISGLEVNLFKNALFGILVEDHLLCYLANTTEYKVGSFLTSYLESRQCMQVSLEPNFGKSGAETDMEG